MAKRLLLIAVGALALTACTSTDVIDDVASSRNVIRFETAVNKPTRAATDLNLKGLNQFFVYGFYTMPEESMHAHEVFRGVPVTKEGGIWSYSSNDVRYWLPGATYYFYAYSCGNTVLNTDYYDAFKLDMETGEKQASDREMKILGYVCDYTHQHDLIFASVEYTAQKTGNDAVAFQFEHILSKLEARFTNSFSKEYDVVIKKVTVDDICNTGTYNFHTNWEDVARPENEQPFVYLLNASGEKASDTPVKVISKDNTTGTDEDKIGVSKAAFVIPNDYTSQSNEKVYLNVTIDVMYGNDVVIKNKNLRATLNPNWQLGHSYIYNIDLNAKAIELNTIEFTVLDEIRGWNSTGGESSPSLDTDNNNNTNAGNEGND